MWYELILFGGIWFWIVFSIFAIWGLVSVWNERGGQSTSAIIIFLLLLTFFGDFNVFTAIYHNPILLLKYGGAYIGVGILWAVIKWYLFNTKIRTVYQNLRADYEDINEITDTKGSKHDWRDYLARPAAWAPVSRYYDFKIPFSPQNDGNWFIPKASEYKDQIIFWMSYWPLSFLFFFVSDFLERLYLRVYDMVASIFVEISRSVFKDIPDDDDDMTQPPRK